MEGLEWVEEQHKTTLFTIEVSFQDAKGTSPSLVNNIMLPVLERYYTSLAAWEGLIK